MSSSHIVGIDLGTTYSLIAVYRNGHAEVIQNPFNNRLTRSIVFYDPDSTDVAVGKFAEEWGLREITNLIYDTKRLIGRKFDDVYVQDLIRNGHYNYKMVRGQNDDVAIEIKQNNQIVTKLPEEVSAEILKYLKEYASRYLDQPINEAVITVPAHFSNAQRKATKKAAVIAGITKVTLISEPVAAAIHYFIDKPKSQSTALVFDFGGGTLDVSVIDVIREMITVRGIEGDSFLGGNDFDKNLAKHFFGGAIASLKKTGNAATIEENLLRVKKKCTMLKVQLYIKEKIQTRMYHFGSSNECFSLEMTRQEFNELNEELFTRAINLVTQCLENLDVSKNDIDQVILVGGSTKIPEIHKLLSSYFTDEKIKTDLNPDEAVALGSAVKAAILNNICEDLRKFKVTEVASNTLGLALKYGLMKPAIKKNTPLPAKSEVLLTETTKNYQTAVKTNIYEGERKNCKYNGLVGTMTLTDFPPRKKGDISFNTVFSLNEDGELEIEKWTFLNSQRAKANFTLNEHGINQINKKRTKAETERDKEEDNIFEDLVLYRCKATSYTQSILFELQKIPDENNREKVKFLCDNFESYDGRDISVNMFDEYKERFEELKNEVDPLIQSHIQV